MSNSLARLKPKKAEAWFASAITSGIQRIYMLNLPNTPSSVAISSTAKVWIETLWDKRIGWNPVLDSERIQQAFRNLAETAEKWPAPKQFIENLPAREIQATRKPCVDLEKRRENLAKLKQELAAVLKENRHGKSGNGEN